jgi:phage terminase small subunit
MKRGRKPLPAAVLAARGSQHGRERLAAERARDRLVRGEPAMPDGLDDEEQAAWRGILTVLPGDVLTVDNGPALGRYAQLIVAWRRAWRNPTVTIPERLAIHDRLHRIEQDFGTTPSSRGRVVPLPNAQAKDPNDMSHYLSGDEKQGEARNRKRLPVDTGV